MGYVHKDAGVGSARGLSLNRKAFGTKNQYTAALPGGGEATPHGNCLKAVFADADKRKISRTWLEKTPFVL
jgi:hypothetical protein